MTRRFLPPLSGRNGRGATRNDTGSQDCALLTVTAAELLRA
jgi:hypothetical protein